MYVFETHKHPTENYIYYRVLHDLTNTELKNRIWLYRDEPARKFTKVSGQVAHKWVRDGGVHTTYLYLDGNIIRKAK